MAAAGAQLGAAPPAPPPAAAAQPTGPTAPALSYAEQVRQSMDLLRALFAQLDAASSSGDPPTGFFEPCRGRPGEPGWEEGRTLCTREMAAVLLSMLDPVYAMRSLSPRSSGQQRARAAEAGRAKMHSSPVLLLPVPAQLPRILSAATCSQLCFPRNHFH